MSHPTTSNRDVFIYQSRDPHTAIPDWLPFRSDITAEARTLALAILVLSKGPLPPAIPEIAERMGVDERTVYRWLNELRSRGALTTELIGRRNFYRFHATPDRGDQVTHGSGDRGDQVTHGSGDPCVRDTPPNPNQFPTQQNAVNSDFSQNPITDRAGGGGGHVFRDSDSPPTTAARRKISPHEITAPAGRWMVAEGFSLTKAHQHQHLPLAPAQADYQRRRQLGQGHGAIALAWEVAPPTGDGQAAPLEPSSGEFTFSEHEKERYRAMGFAFGSEMPEESEESQ
jgi:DNA-binding transcriptional ArsR family regulator